MFARMLGDDELGDIVFVLDGLDECDQTSLTLPLVSRLRRI
jgi:hypothetical protein